jgi:PAS domain S-box-containing protein
LSKQKLDAIGSKLNQLFILNWLGNRVRVSNDLQEAANISAWAVAEAIGFDTVCLWLTDESNGTRRLAACHSAGGEKPQLPAEIPRLEALKLNKSEAFITWWPIREKFLGKCGNGPDAEVAVAPLVTYNPENRQLVCWEHFNCDDEKCPARSRPFLSCWMIKDGCRKLRGHDDNLLARMDICGKCGVYQANIKGRNFGLICADNHISRRPITQDDLNSMNMFANSAASLLSNIMKTEKIKRNEHLLDSIIFNMSAGLLVTDLSGRVQMINSSGSNILGCEREAVMGKDITLIYPETARMLEAKPRIGAEAEVLTEGGTVPVGFTSNHLINHDGKPEGFVVVFRDLREIKKLQEELHEKERFAAVGKVAAGVAHEIRNPLFGITSVAQIIARETKEESPLKPLIQAMLSETARLNRLVEDMLLYNRTMKIKRQPVDIGALIEDVLGFHFKVIKEKGITVIKECSDLETAMLDISQIRQVFLNLLINALDASCEGETIKISAKTSEGAVRIKISDNGMGIPKDDLPKIFDLFFSTKEKGTGIGLALCRKIIEDHGGTIAVKSAPGAGTGVEIELPHVPVESQEV